MLSKKANHFLPFKYGCVQTLDILNFNGGDTSLDKLLKAYKTSETKIFFPFEWFNHPDKLNNKELLPYEAFHNKLRKCNPFEKEHLDYAKLRMLELYFTALEKLCDTDKYEMEMHTDSLYLALAEKEMYDSIRSEKRRVGIVTQQRLY